MDSDKRATTGEQKQVGTRQSYTGKRVYNSSSPSLLFYTLLLPTSPTSLALHRAGWLMTAAFSALVSSGPAKGDGAGLVGAPMVLRWVRSLKL